MYLTMSNMYPLKALILLAHLDKEQVICLTIVFSYISAVIFLFYFKKFNKKRWK